MNNPYEILGVHNNASDEEIRQAYREKAREITQDGENGDSSAEARLTAINDAYDTIILSRGSSGSYHQSRASDGVFSEYTDIRQKIQAGRIEDALLLLDGIPQERRGAEWHFLKGTICHRRGWLEQAMEHFQHAAAMEPQNAEYRAAYDAMQQNSAGGFRTSRRTGNRGCSGCEICEGLICADCCCECMGGDLIPCC